MHVAAACRAGLLLASWQDGFCAPRALCARQGRGAAAALRFLHAWVFPLHISGCARVGPLSVPPVPWGCPGLSRLPRAGLAPPRRHLLTPPGPRAPSESFLFPVLPRRGARPAPPRPLPFAPPLPPVPWPSATRPAPAPVLPAVSGAGAAGRAPCGLPRRSRASLPPGPAAPLLTPLRRGSASPAAGESGRGPAGCA